MKTKTFLVELIDCIAFIYEAQKNRKFGRRYLINKWLVERRILTTKPCLITSSSPNCEVHIMTYDFDWLMALWAAKSFFTYSEVSWPLIWHQGGSLSLWRRKFMQDIFPGSRFCSFESANEIVEPILSSQPFVSSKSNDAFIDDLVIIVRSRLGKKNTNSTLHNFLPQ